MRNDFRNKICQQYQYLNQVCQVFYIKKICARGRNDNDETKTLGNESMSVQNNIFQPLDNDETKNLKNECMSFQNIIFNNISINIRMDISKYFLYSFYKIRKVSEMDQFGLKFIRNPVQEGNPPCKPPRQ